MSPFDVPDSDQLTLVTADEPPIRHSVSRSHLSTLSITFRDLLSLPLSPASTSSNEITIGETHLELKGFMRMLEALGKGEEADLSELKFVDWENLARVSDKYDSIMARMRVKSHAWYV